MIPSGYYDQYRLRIGYDNGLELKSRDAFVEKIDGCMKQNTFVKHGHMALSD